MVVAAMPSQRPRPRDGRSHACLSWVGRNESGRSAAVMDVCTAIMPQPMSTPTAAGMIALCVGTTEPTVAPTPMCTSGITATHLCTKGMLAMFLSWATALSSMGTPRVQCLMGACSVPRMS